MMHLLQSSNRVALSFCNRPFYQFNWKESAIDPAGTYFSETDLFGDGGNTAYNNFAGTAVAPAIAGYNQLSAFAGPLSTATGLYASGVNTAYGNILKVADVAQDLNAKNDGQFGVSFKYIVEELNSTEFGAYFVNYHAKEPTIYADLNGYQGVNIQGLAAFDPGTGALGLPTAVGLATVDILGSTQAKREYAEDIRMYGFSFNTTINETSVFGELAYRPNLPVGIAATNDLLGDLVIQGGKLADNSGIAGEGSAIISGQQVFRDSSISNYRRVEAYNLSLGAIHNFGNALSFDSLFGVAEIASEHYRGDSLKYTGVAPSANPDFS